MHASFCVVCFHRDGRWICWQLRCFPLTFSSIRPRSSSSPSSFSSSATLILSLLLSATSSSPYASRLLFFLPWVRERTPRFGLNPSHTMKPKISVALRECGAWLPTSKRRTDRQEEAPRFLSFSLVLFRLFFAFWKHCDTSTSRSERSQREPRLNIVSKRSVPKN